MKMMLLLLTYLQFKELILSKKLIRLLESFNYQALLSFSY